MGFTGKGIAELKESFTEEMLGDDLVEEGWVEGHFAACLGDVLGARLVDYLQVMRQGGGG